ncbi:MAG: hypothetical protein FWG99_08515 [Treponema sp.]|nr:hypothetical protein [Treponema sp.]
MRRRETKTRFNTKRPSSITAGRGKNRITTAIIADKGMNANFFESIVVSPYENSVPTLFNHGMME